MCAATAHRPTRSTSCVGTSVVRSETWPSTLKRPRPCLRRRWLPRLRHGRPKRLGPPHPRRPPNGRRHRAYVSGEGGFRQCPSPPRGAQRLGWRFNEGTLTTGPSMGQCAANALCRVPAAAIGAHAAEADVDARALTGRAAAEAVVDANEPSVWLAPPHRRAGRRAHVAVISAALSQTSEPRVENSPNGIGVLPEQPGLARPEVVLGRDLLRVRL